MAARKEGTKVVISEEREMDAAFYFEMKYNRLAQRVNQLLRANAVDEVTERYLRDDLEWEPNI